MDSEPTPIADRLDKAIDATEKPKEDKGVDALAQVTLTFLADGGMHMAVAGDFRPAMAWAMSEFLRNVGDRQFAEATARAEAIAKARQPQIVVPMSSMQRVDR